MFGLKKKEIGETRMIGIHLSQKIKEIFEEERKKENGTNNENQDDKENSKNTK